MMRISIGFVVDFDYLSFKFQLWILKATPSHLNFIIQYKMSKTNIQKNYIPPYKGFDKCKYYKKDKNTLIRILIDVNSRIIGSEKFDVEKNKFVLSTTIKGMDISLYADEIGENDFYQYCEQLQIEHLIKKGVNQEDAKAILDVIDRHRDTLELLHKRDSEKN